MTYETAPDRKPGKVCAKRVRFVSDDKAAQEEAPAGLFDTGAVSGVALADWLTRDQQ